MARQESHCSQRAFGMDYGWDVELTAERKPVQQAA